MPKKKSKKDSQAGSLRSDLEKEAAEQRRLAEEERIRIEEQQRKIRELEELKLDEKISVFLTQDKTRLGSLLEDYKGMTNRYGEELKQKLADNLKEIQWKEYLKCSNLPNPKIEQDLNTFLMLWKDEKLVFDDLPSLNTLYDQLPAGVKLMEELQIEKAELIAAGNHAKADLIQNYITKLSQILLDKCDMTTHQIIQNVHRYSRESTENFQAEGSENAFKFGLWTNLTNNPMVKNVEFQKAAMTCSIPKSLTLQNVAIRMIYSNEISAIIPEAADGRKSVSGGLLFLDLLELSDPPKVVNNWTISQGTLAFKLVSGRTNIVKVPYPKKRDEMEESKIDDSVNSFQVGLRIPNYSANSKIMFWNESAKDWDSDGIRDQQFDPITKKLSFWTSRFAPHALIQVTEYLIKDLYAEFPYKNWSIEPRNRGIVLTIEGQNNQVSIQVAENGDCNAVGVSEVAETYAPSLLLKKLSQSGLSFIAPPESTVPQLLSKSLDTEAHCIEGIAHHSLSMKFQKSPCNSSLSSSKVAFQFRSLSGGLEAASEWNTLVYNSLYKLKEELFPLAFVAESNEITDKTKLNLNGSDSKLVITMFNIR